MDSSLGTVSQFAVALLGFLNLTSATTISKFPFTASVAEDIESRAVANRDIRYDVWSNSQRILFRLDPVYSKFLLFRLFLSEVALPLMYQTQLQMKRRELSS